MQSEVIEITSCAYGGDGVGRLSDGRICFVPGVTPGEIAGVKIIAEKKRFCRGEVVEIFRKSDHRQDAPCPLYGHCPGCAYMHMDYACEVEIKSCQLRDFLVRGKVASPEVIKSPFASPSELFYRNKLVLHHAGYVASDNRSIIPVKKCFLADEKINDILGQAGGGETLFRKSSTQEAAQIISPETPGIIRENIDGAGNFSVAGNGFFQTNMAVASELVRQVKTAVKLSGCRHLLELYCGVGVFSIALAESFPELCCTGVEVNSQAIRFAKQNAAEHQVSDRCRFYAMDALKALKRFRNHPDWAVLVDPPRGGMEKPALQKLLEVDARQIIYISCAADTLVRDLQILVPAGYEVRSAQMLDMFPRTAHFEVLCVLQKR